MSSKMTFCVRVLFGQNGFLVERAFQAKLIFNLSGFLGKWLFCQTGFKLKLFWGETVKGCSPLPELEKPSLEGLYFQIFQKLYNTK